MAKPREPLPHVVRVSFWNEYMNGSTVGEIARYSWHDLHTAGLPGRECSPAEVRRVLEDEPPQPVRDDLRYVHGVRAFWISAVGEMEDGHGTAASFVVAFQPWRLTSQAFRKGVRTIVRDFKDNCPAGHIDPNVIEGFEMDVALRFVEKGVPAWILDEEGAVARYAGEYGTERSPDAAPGI